MMKYILILISLMLYACGADDGSDNGSAPHGSDLLVWGSSNWGQGNWQ